MNLNQPLLQIESEPELMMDINTTPLIDVMLVLLIMLIITIPLQLHAIDLELPAQAALMQTEKKNDAVIIDISVDANGAISWNDKQLANQQDLDTMLNNLVLEQGPEPDIHIKADAMARYEAVAGVLANAQRRGLKKLSIVGTEDF
jgi:biopolymer transport protein ExbD